MYLTMNPSMFQERAGEAAVDALREVHGTVFRFGSASTILCKLTMYSLFNLISMHTHLFDPISILYDCKAYHVQ